MAPKNIEKRNEILTVAYNCFGEAHYNQVTLEEIARGAGINKSLLQHYYSKKSDIISALLEELLNTAYSYMELLPYTYDDIFCEISDFNMLFFKGAAYSKKLDQFVTSSVSQPEVLNLWIEIISGWLQKLCGENSFSYLQLKTAINFSMSGSMRLYQYKDELGLDYKFITNNHIETIMRLLQFKQKKIEEVTKITRERCDSISAEDYLQYCVDSIQWLSI